VTNRKKITAALRLTGQPGIATVIQITGLQSTPWSSTAAAHLGLGFASARLDRVLSASVVVSMDGQRSPRISTEHP
jgi:hypothetical protein